MESRNGEFGRRTNRSAALPVNVAFGAVEAPFARDMVGDVGNGDFVSLLRLDASRNGFRDTGRGGASVESAGNAVWLRKGLLDDRLGESPGDPGPIEISYSS